jgi:hypothetical protein
LLAPKLGSTAPGGSVSYRQDRSGHVDLARTCALLGGFEGPTAPHINAIEAVGPLPLRLISAVQTSAEEFPEQQSPNHQANYGCGESGMMASGALAELIDSDFVWIESAAGAHLITSVLSP